MATIIFDFDGTIADTFDDVVQILHDLTGRHEPLPPDEIERLRGMTLLNAAEDMHVAPWKMPFMIIRIRRRMKRKMPDVQAHRGIEEVIKKLQAEGHQLYITSTNSGRNIQAFLRRDGLVYEFVRIYSGVGLFHKTRALKKIIRQNNLNPDDTWYVGDEVRDIVGGQQAGVRVLAVAWGYNSAAILREHHPAALVRSPAELLKILEEE